MVLHNLTARNLFLFSFTILSFVFNSGTTHSWRNNSSVDDIGQQCTPSDYPFSMCKSEAAAYSYPCEDHTVMTEDGYILSLKRIPHGISNGDNSTRNTRQPVLLFHGLMVERILLDKPCATESYTPMHT